MTQHINLLRKQRLVPPSLVWGGLGVVAILSAHLAYGLSILQDNQQAQARVRAQETELQALRASLVQSGQGSQGSVQVQADIARLTPLALSYAGVLELARGGRLGLESGYLDHLTTLARTVEPNVWITQVSLGEAGRKLSLQGKALSEQGVLTYADRLNQAYRAQGLSMSALELTVDQAPAVASAAVTAASGPSPRPAAAPAGKTISFRLN